MQLELTIHLIAEDEEAKTALTNLTKATPQPSNKNPFQPEGETYKLFLVYEDPEELREIPINNIARSDLGQFKFKVKLEPPYPVDSFRVHIKLVRNNGDETTATLFYKNDKKEEWIVSKPQAYYFLPMDLKEENKTTVKSKTKPIESASEDDSKDTESDDRIIFVEDLPVSIKGIVGPKKEVPPLNQPSSPISKFATLLNNLFPFKQKPKEGRQKGEKNTKQAVATSSDFRKDHSATSSGSSLSTDSSNATTRTSSPTRGGR